MSDADTYDIAFFVGGKIDELIRQRQVCPRISVLGAYKSQSPWPLQTLVKGFSELDERFNQIDQENGLLRENLEEKQAELDKLEEKRRETDLEVSKLRDALQTNIGSSSHDAKLESEGVSLHRMQTLEELAFIPQNLSDAFQQHSDVGTGRTAAEYKTEVRTLKAKISTLEQQLAELHKKHAELEQEISNSKQEQELVWEQHEQDKLLDSEALACLERENDLLRAEAARLNKRLKESLDKQERSTAELQAELVLLMKERDQAHRRAEAAQRCASGQTRTWATAMTERVMQERLALEQDRGFSTFQRERIAQSLQRLQAAIAALPHDDPARGTEKRPSAGGEQEAAAQLEERIGLLEAQLTSERLQNEKLKQAIVRERTRPFNFGAEGSPEPVVATTSLSGFGGTDGDGGEVERLREQLRAASQCIQSLTVPRASGAAAAALPRATGKGSPQVRRRRRPRRRRAVRHTAVDKETRESCSL
jgi:DNA repair exonuclease SbcCD ATPase subunit